MSPTPSAATPNIIVLPPFVYLAGLVGGYIIHFLWPVAIVPPLFDVAIRAIGIVVILIAGWLMFTALGMFQRIGTPVNPHKPPTALAVDGPYRFSRNPMYLGMACIEGGLALVGNALWPLLALIPVIWWIETQVIAREEIYLEAKFGAPYRDFKGRVRRWL